MATLSEPGFDVDQWIGNACLTGSGRRLVVVYGPRTFTNRADLFDRGGFTAVVDQAKLGLPLAALLLLNVDQHSWRELSDELRQVPGFEYLALTSGEFDMVLLVRVPDIAALRDVVLVKLTAMPQIRTTRTIFVLDEVR